MKERLDEFRAKHLTLRKAVASFLLVAIIAWAVFLWSYGPERVVELIGVENGVLLAFLIAAFGGLSMFTATGWYATMITLAAGGVNPLALGIGGGLGLTLGDSLFYYLGSTGRYALPKHLGALSQWIQSQPRYLVPSIIFLWAGFSPLPNEVITVGFGLGGYRYRWFVPPLLAGNVLLALMVAFAAATGHVLW